MLQFIVEWSIRNRVVVVFMAVGLLLLGIYAAGHSRLDVFPEFAPPQVVIQTEAPGLSAPDVEQRVTRPIEDEVNSIPRRHVLRSESIQGLSVVTIVFKDGTDIHRARQHVSERLAQVRKNLPPGVEPKMAPLTSTTGRLVTVGFTSSKLSAMHLRDRVQREVQRKLLQVEGVVQVTIFGGAVRQFQIQFQPEALAVRRLNQNDVLEAARQASSIRAAGFIERAGQRIAVRVEGQVRTAAELGETVVATFERAPVLLRDVAIVAEGPEPKFGDAALYVAADRPPDTPVDPEPGVVLIIYKQVDEDTLEVTRRVEAELDRLQPILESQGIQYHKALFRQANFIEHAVGNVVRSLIIGAVLVAVVLFIFLFNLRTALISLTAIPLSLFSAVIVLWAWGVGLNTMTLGGLAIAVGEVVDDAIIDVENIFRRLRENVRLGRPRSTLAVVLSASLEVRSAVVYATFIVALVFIPVFFLSGLQGRLFAPLGYAYVLAVMASLGIALTVTPALAVFLLPNASGAEEPPLLRRLQNGYERLIRLLDRGFIPLVGCTVLLVVLALAVFFRFGGDFLPELRENHFVVHMRGLPGTSLPLSMIAGKHVTRELQQLPEVRSITQQAGRAELGEDTWGVHYSEIEVDLKPLGARAVAQVQAQMKKALADRTVGFSYEIMPFLTERIKETISGSPAAVTVKIYGADLEALNRTAQDIANILRKVPGNDKVRVEAQTGAPELVIEPRMRDAARYGLRNAAIVDAVHAAYQGAEAGQTYDRDRIIDLIVVQEPTVRSDLLQAGKLLIPVPAGGRGTQTTTAEASGTTPQPAPGTTSLGHVELEKVANVFMSETRFLIAHEGATRRQLVTCNVKGRDVSSFVAEAQSKVRDALPKSIDYRFEGEHQARQAAQREILLLSLAALAGIMLLLWMVFGSVRRLLLLFVNLPFALVGGVAAIYIAGAIRRSMAGVSTADDTWGNLDVGALIGFVTLFGITTRNGIMMISHWQHLREVEGMSWGPELVFRGARERLAPVLMTALVTALGLLPIAIGSGEAGREIEGPMAWVILGGLVTSTALNLLVLPVLYRRFGESGSEVVSGEVVG